MPEDETQEEEQTVEVPAEQLDKLVNKVDELEEKTDNLEEENEKLKYASDKGRQQEYERQQEGEMVMEVGVPFYPYETEDGEVKELFMQAWEMVKDQVRVTQDGNLIADQQIKLYLKDEDGEDYEVVEPYKAFHTNRKLKEAEVIEETQKRTKDGEDVTMYKVRLDNGRELEIDSKYIN